MAAVLLLVLYDESVSDCLMIRVCVVTFVGAGSGAARMW